MGNSHSNPQSHGSQKPLADPKLAVNPEIRELYTTLTEKGPLSSQRLSEKFGDLSDALLAYFGPEISEEEFARKVKGLTGSSGDKCLVMLCRGATSFDRYGVECLMSMCWKCGDLQQQHNPGDDEFISALATDVLGSADHSMQVNPDSLMEWTALSCPRLTHRLQNHLRNIIHPQQPIKTHSFPKSNNLTPMQLWFVQSALPPVFGGDNCEWKPLLLSSQHGLSYRTFEKHVFGYPGPTVSVLETTDGDIFILAIDEPWRDSPKPWGKSSSTLMQLVYKFGIREQGSNIVLFNSKTRGIPNVLCVGNPTMPAFHTASDFSKLHSLEVWGCAGESASDAHKHQKQWEAKQVEIQKQVPLPGNWDENPDRSLLEMAGINRAPSQYSTQ